MSWNAKKTAARTAALLSCYFAARGFADMAGGDSLPAQWMILAVLSGLFLLLNLRFFRRTQAKESGIRLSGVILAAVFDFCFVTGFMLEQSGQQEILPLRDAPVLRFLFYAALLWNTVLLTAEADRMIDRPSTPGRDSEQAIRKWLRFLPLILFAGWLPHWIANFPGSVCNDARDQLEMAMGVIPLTNHNPVLDTWIFGGLYRIGKGVSGSGNAGIALIVFVQTALMALSFSLVIAEGYEWMLRRKRNGGRFVPFSVLFYLIVPIFGGAAQIVLKDTLNLPFFLFMTALQMRLLRQPDRLRDKIAYAAALVLVSLTRVMSVWFALASATGSVALYVCRRREIAKGQIRDLVLAAGTALAIVILWDTVLIPALGIEQYPSREKYATPIQQTAYTALEHRDGLTEEEERILEDAIGLERIGKKYNPNLADHLKTGFRESAAGEFMGLYTSWLVKYPGDMLHGLITSHYKFFFPLSAGNENYRSYIANCSSFDEGIDYASNPIHNKVKKFFKRWDEHPLTVLLMGPGLYTWMLFFTLARCRKNRDGAAFLILLPLVLLCAGLLLTPLNGETRYAYPIIASVPLYAVFCIRRAPENRS